MSQLTDLNATGNGLSAVAGGLQGLLEAYKLKMAQQVEQAKITQQGLDSGAQARAMSGYYAQMANAAGLNAGTNRFTATGILPPIPGAGDGSTTTTPTATPTTTPISNPFMDQVQQFKEGKIPSLDMTKPAIQVAWSAAAKPGDKSYNELIAAQKQKDFLNSPATIQEQHDAQSVMDNLATQKAMLLGVGLPEKSPSGMFDPVTLPNAIKYLRIKSDAVNPGTPAANLLSRTDPSTAAMSKIFEGRFNMGEVPMNGKPTSITQPLPSVANGIDTYINQLRTKTGQPNYIPKVLTDTIDLSQNPNIKPGDMWSPGIPGMTTAAAAAPTPPAGPMATLKAALPPAPAAGSLPAAVGAPLAPKPGKYDAMTPAQMQAEFARQQQAGQ